LRLPNNDQGVINLEHILPDKPDGNWPQFSDDEIKMYRNRIGNLALLRATENSDLRSSDFASKKAVYACSPYELTKHVARAEAWTTTEINERQKMLADLAVKAWAI
jgi:uncharacterized protein DUF1524